MPATLALPPPFAKLSFQGNRQPNKLDFTFFQKTLLNKALQDFCTIKHSMQ